MLRYSGRLGKKAEKATGGEHLTTQIEHWDSWQPDLLSIPLCLQPPVDEAVIVPDVGNRAIWGDICEGRLEKVRLSCRVFISLAAPEKHTDAFGSRAYRAPSHLEPSSTAVIQSVQS